ncbi:hypothetical protein BD769DRAFT_1386622 [Suillus cothurnatus]|nr:hypothetical protein BD769DRAFT_1386622 [Suillus cothurnatus]
MIGLLSLLVNVPGRPDSQYRILRQNDNHYTSLALYHHLLHRTFTHSTTTISTWRITSPPSPNCAQSQSQPGFWCIKWNGVEHINKPIANFGEQQEESAVLQVLCIPSTRDLPVTPGFTLCITHLITSNLLPASPLLINVEESDLIFEAQNSEGYEVTKVMFADGKQMMALGDAEFGLTQLQLALMMIVAWLVKCEAFSIVFRGNPPGYPPM